MRLGGIRVSIRSPHKSKGRRSALAAKSRASVVSIRSPHKSKGRLFRHPCGSRRGGVSIRSPHKSKGRPSCNRTRAMSRKFQSAPLTKARGDADRRPGGPAPPGFNPLPSQKQGETPAPRAHRGTLLGFNPLPSQKQGETRGAISALRTDEAFQSAPLTKARGDSSTPHRRIAACTVSIRSPHKSKGRLQWLWTPIVDVGFQSAPLTKARGDPVRRDHTHPCVCFNPLPSQKQGET